MAYQPAIPQATDKLSVSQGDLLGNFQSLDTVYAVNHTALTASDNVGFHTKVTLPYLGSAPGVSGDGYGVLYTMGSGADTQLWYQNNTDSYQITGNQSAMPTGYVVIPGGITLHWGISAATSTASAVSFTPNFANDCVNVVATPATSTLGIIASVLSPTKFGFTLSVNTSTSTNVYWVATGY
jgi:hypothetical protein